MKHFPFVLLLLFVQIIPFILISCTDPVSTIINPTVLITNPVMNSNVPDSATVNVEIISSNNFSGKPNIIRVELFIDHSIVTTLTKPPYKYLWYTGYYQDGTQHIIEAKVYDDRGNIYTPPTSIVYVYRFMPSWLTADIISSSSIILNWVDNCHYETGFEIEQATGDSTFKKIATVDSNTTSYTLKGSFQKDQKYLFRVRAKASNSFSGYTNTAIANIVLKAPDITNVVFTSDTTATISWNDNSEFETVFSILQMKNGNFINIKNVWANTTTAAITGEFISGEYYEFEVVAVDNLISSTSIPRYFSYIFNPPTNLSVSEIDINKVQLSWTNSTSLSTKIKIERKIAGSVYGEIGTVNAGTTKFTDINLDTSKTYYYRVKAYTRINNVYSNEIKITFSPQIVDYRKIKAPSNIAGIDISRDSKYIVMGGYTSNSIVAYLLDANDGSLIRTYYPHDSLQICDNIGISYDNSVIAGGGYAYNVDLWNVSDASFRGVLNLGYYVAGLVFHPFKNVVVTFTDNFNIIGIWNYETRTKLFNINMGERIRTLSISKNGNLLAAAGENDIKIIDISTGTIIKMLPGNSLTASFCDDDKTVISGSVGKISLWNIDNLTSAEFNLPSEQILDIIVVPGTNYAIFADNGGYVLLDKSSGNIISRFNTSNDLSRLRLLPDNTIVSYGWSTIYFRKIEKRWVMTLE